MTITRLAKADTDGDIVDYQGRKLATQQSVAAITSGLTESVQDIVGAALRPGANVTVTYDDTAGTITIASTATGSAGLDAEALLDFLAGVTTPGQGLVASGTGVTLTYDDAGNKITVAIGPHQHSATDVSVGQFGLDRMPSGIGYFVPYTLTSRPTIPAGLQLVIIGGTSPVSWIQPGDLQFMAP